MNLFDASRHADRLLDWLAPYTDPASGNVIHIAGSIRRQRPVVNDIDLVCIPKVLEQKDMLGALISFRIPMLDFLSDYILSQNPNHSRLDTRPHVISGFDPLDSRHQPSTPNHQPPKQVLVWLPKIKTQLDLWLATEQTLATRLLCRTGSKEHNIFLCQRAQQLNGHWDPYEGLQINRVPIPTPNEASLYAALDLPCIDPENREAAWINKHLTAQVFRSGSQSGL